jgi:hypothetical protein
LGLGVGTCQTENKTDTRTGRHRTSASRETDPRTNNITSDTTRQCFLALVVHILDLDTRVTGQNVARSTNTDIRRPHAHPHSCPHFCPHSHPHPQTIDIARRAASHYLDAPTSTSSETNTRNPSKVPSVSTNRRHLPEPTYTGRRADGCLPSCLTQHESTQRPLGNGDTPRPIASPILQSLQTTLLRPSSAPVLDCPDLTNSRLPSRHFYYQSLKPPDGTFPRREINDDEIRSHRRTRPPQDHRQRWRRRRGRRIFREALDRVGCAPRPTIQTTAAEPAEGRRDDEAAVLNALETTIRVKARIYALISAQLRRAVEMMLGRIGVDGSDATLATKAILEATSSDHAFRTTCKSSLMVGLGLQVPSIHSPVPSLYSSVPSMYSPRISYSAGPSMYRPVSSMTPEHQEAKRSMCAGAERWISSRDELYKTGVELREAARQRTCMLLHQLSAELRILVHSHLGCLKPAGTKFNYSSTSAMHKGICSPGKA